MLKKMLNNEKLINNNEFFFDEDISMMALDLYIKVLLANENYF